MKVQQVSSFVLLPRFLFKRDVPLKLLLALSLGVAILALLKEEIKNKKKTCHIYIPWINLGTYQKSLNYPLATRIACLLQQLGVIILLTKIPKILLVRF